MTNQECIDTLTKLKNELIGNLAVFHERVTLLVELIEFNILEKNVQFKAKIIKPLDKEHAEKNKLYKYMINKEFISFGASYQFYSNNLINGKKIGRPYCPFTLWLDPELTEFVKSNDDEITKKIPKFILWGEDWTVLKNN
jgi:hypothetical protein